MKTLIEKIFAKEFKAEAMHIEAARDFVCRNLIRLKV